MGRTVPGEVSSLLLITFGIAIFAMARTFSGGRAGEPGPGFFPELIGVGIIILAFVDVATRRRFDSMPRYEINDEQIKIFIIVTGSLALYIMVIPVVGFVLATTSYLYIIGSYSKVPFFHRIVMAVVSPIILHFMFSEFLSLRLPELPIISELLTLPF